MNIELLSNQTFNPKTDLLILDEIGECERAVTALKYLQKRPRLTLLLQVAQTLDYSIHFLWARLNNTISAY